MAMENSESESLSVDSFSQSWLINPEPFDITDSCSIRSSIDEEGLSSFIVMDPRLPASKRFFRDVQNSNFHFPDSKSPVPLVHAGDLFHNGRILPRTASSLKKEAAGEDDICSNVSGNMTASTCKDVVTSSKNYRCPLLKRGRTISINVFHRYLSCLQPFICRRGTRSKVAENWMASPETLPRTSIASYSVDDYWRKSCGSESSIDEAVLHCKRSISK
ncbi:hypothetical protein QQ045_029292 [Rhodiola kirilowii]